MIQDTPFREFLAAFEQFLAAHPELIKLTLRNIFTMRLLGNKTHGDLAEVAMAEFINQYVPGYQSTHVGKELFRSKDKEQDINVTNESNDEAIPISLKAYGHGPLQLSTDKEFLMFPRLKRAGNQILGDEVKRIMEDPAFQSFDEKQVLPLIYDEELNQCNIMVFDFARAEKAIASIHLIESGHGRQHPVYRFFDEEDRYICEVRYGGPEDNALQRGLWTHTRNSSDYFKSLTGGWVEYEPNRQLLELFSRALVSDQASHESALDAVNEGIGKLMRQEKLGD